MPYSKCPLCGCTFHLRVSNVEQWYAERYPQLPVGSLVPGKCFFCWPDLAPGDEIVIRTAIGNEPAVAINTRGRVMAILACEDGEIYKVQLATGDERFFVRGELRKRREDEG